MKIVFIADFFVEQVLGGGELNNEECINILKNKNFDVIKIQSHLVTPDLLNTNKDNKFIVANFINLTEECKNLLQTLQYVIYEHDHKYLKTRNPQNYENFKAPPDQIINYDFYKNSQAVLCQSGFHLSIVEKNLGLDNIVNLSGNLWTLDTLDLMKELCAKDKLDKCSVLQSPIAHKNTRQAVRFCEYKKRDYELVASAKHEEFLDKISNNKTFVFFPKTPETLSRVVVEARMMGMSVITNKLVGAAQEAWYAHKGLQLIEEITQMRERIPNTVLEKLGVH
jgi:hypothetical protein